MTIINYFITLISKKLKGLSWSNLPLFLFAFFISISNSISAIMIIFFFLSFVFCQNKHEKIKYVIKQPVNQSILIFFTFILISFFWSDQIYFFQSIYKYSILLLIPFLGLLNFKKSDKKTASFLFIIGLVFNIIYSFFISKLYQFGIFGKLFFLKGGHYENDFFFRGFIDHSSLSLFIAFSIFIFLTYLFNETKNKKNISLYFLIFMFVLFLLNSYGRTGFFTLILLLPVFFLITKPRQLKVFFLFTIPFLCIAIIISQPFKTRIQKTFTFKKNFISNQEKIEKDAQYMSDSLGKNINYWVKKINADPVWKNEVINKTPENTMKNRYEIWKKYKIQIIQNPILGMGAGGIEKILEEKNFINNRPHNTYILIITEFGIIGLILFLNIFYVQIKTFFREKKEKILQIIFPLFFLTCMLINDYIIIYNTVCFFSLFSCLLYSVKSLD